MVEMVKEEQEVVKEEGTRHLVTRVPALNPRLLGGSMVRRPTPPSWKSHSVAHYTRPLPHQAATSSGRRELL